MKSTDERFPYTDVREGRIENMYGVVQSILNAGAMAEVSRCEGDEEAAQQFEAAARGHETRLNIHAYNVALHCINSVYVRGIVQIAMSYQ